ncbi:MAG: disulfide bond formation protein B [Tepidimonas sp.]|uniref:disulfide bond formation protein B n=1 Tax=Tepidimonas sp. TaxID=2002775 RepID=UPI004054AD3D
MPTKASPGSLRAWLASPPRAVMVALVLWCAALLGFGLYLQHAVGLEPCPMCIVQRYVLIAVALTTAVAGLVGAGWRRPLAWLAGVLAIAGAAVAARQSWLQWYPPEILSCGRDLFGMIASFPLQRAIPMIFRGSGDCTAIDWTFLGLTIANWSFLNFVAMAGVLAAWLRCHRT